MTSFVFPFQCLSSMQTEIANQWLKFYVIKIVLPEERILINIFNFQDRQQSIKKVQFSFSNLGKESTLETRAYCANHRKSKALSNYPLF